MRGIESTSDGLRIGALEKMSDVAEHPRWQPTIQSFPKRCLKAPPRSFATWQAWEEIFCNGLGVDTSGM
jgi:hypothetical protein